MSLRVVRRLDRLLTTHNLRQTSRASTRAKITPGRIFVEAGGLRHLEETALRCNLRAHGT
jgi:hypothetical protein